MSRLKTGIESVPYVFAFARGTHLVFFLYLCNYMSTVNSCCTGGRMREFTNCPFCTAPLSEIVDNRPSCPHGCYTHYDNPQPTVAILIEVPRALVGTRPTFTKPTDELSDTGGIVLVKRKSGRWCLPCGFVDHGATPAQAAKGEVFEETNLVVELTELIAYFNPAPSKVNHTVAFYQGRVLSGTLQYGDDAIDAQVFSIASVLEGSVEIEFPSHRELLEDRYGPRAAPHYGPHRMRRYTLDIEE